METTGIEEQAVAVAINGNGGATVAPLVGLVTVIWANAGAAHTARAARTGEANKDLREDMDLLWCHR